jgi:hypothetical protein
MAEQELDQFATKADFERTERQLENHQKEIKYFGKAMTEVVATQKEMQNTFSHFSKDFDGIRSDIQRLFDRRSDDLQNSRPNYFAWVVGGVTVLGSMMVFVFTFVTLVISPIQASQSDIIEVIKNLDYEVENHEDISNIRLQEGNEFMGGAKKELEMLREDVEWNHEQIIEMLKIKNG